jgi:hypothetical protein
MKKSKRLKRLEMEDKISNIYVAMFYHNVNECLFLETEAKNEQEVKRYEQMRSDVIDLVDTEPFKEVV